jgi:hypothetical protein
MSNPDGDFDESDSEADEGITIPGSATAMTET